MFGLEDERYQEIERLNKIISNAIEWVHDGYGLGCTCDGVSECHFCMEEIQEILDILETAKQAKELCEECNGAKGWVGHTSGEWRTCHQCWGSGVKND